MIFQRTQEIHVTHVNVKMHQHQRKISPLDVETYLVDFSLFVMCRGATGAAALLAFPNRAIPGRRLVGWRANEQQSSRLFELSSQSSAEPVNIL